MKKICITLYSDVFRDEYIESCDDAFGNPQATDPCLDISRIGVFQIQLPFDTPRGTEIDVLFKNNGETLDVIATVVKTGEETKTVFEI